MLNPGSSIAKTGEYKINDMAMVANIAYIIEIDFMGSLLE